MNTLNILSNVFVPNQLICMYLSIETIATTRRKVTMTKRIEP
jgi:hypothetical protein